MARRRAEEATVDCLIVSFYDEDIPTDGDYLTLDVKRWAGSQCGVRMGVALYGKQMENFQISRLTRRLVVGDEDLALAFMKVNQPAQTDLGKVAGDLAPWLQAVDTALEPGSPVKEKPREALRKMMERGAQKLGRPGQRVKAADLLNDPKITDRRSFSLPNAEDGVCRFFRGRNRWSRRGRYAIGSVSMGNGRQ